MIVRPNFARLREFILALGELVDTSEEPGVLASGATLLSELVVHDDWLPDAYAQHDPDHYRQYLLHCDSRERFSLVSFVWGPGQATPIHDHGVWGLVGVLRGAEISEPWQRASDGRLVRAGNPIRLGPGDVDRLSSASGDIHRVANACQDQVSISIHVYGGNIGGVRRRSYQADGTEKSFVSGYSNATCPNFWAL